MTPLEIYEWTVPFALLLFIGVPGIVFANWSAKRLEQADDSQTLPRK